MDIGSIDQVIQSSQDNLEPGRGHQLNGTSLHENGTSNDSQSAYTAAMKRKNNTINQHQPAPSTSSTSSTATSQTPATSRSSVTDFFSSEIFQMVLGNPTTSYRFLKFCEKRACGENMEFLAEMQNYNRILDELTKSMSSIQRRFTGTNADEAIDISSQDSRVISNSIKHSVTNVIPSLEFIFIDAQEQIENSLMKDVYPRFVKHQITTSASLALGADRNHVGAYQGLGDCFCLTDPSKTDNPIVFASDGFVDVTGYTRKEIVPRNCRFLQGQLTDRSSIKRLKASIDSAEEIVELILNYRKDGEPFWNLLYVSPLRDGNGKVVFYLGAQINCSTTINSHTDILRILSLPEDEDDARSLSERSPSLQSNRLRRLSSARSGGSGKHRSNFFKTWPSWKEGKKNVKVVDEPGVEAKLMENFRKVDTGFEGKLEAFYTAYSKYLILSVSSQSPDLNIKFYSPSMFEFLLLPQMTHQSQHSNPLSRHEAPSSLSNCDREIFKILADQPLSANIGKTFKQTVREAIRHGKAVSVELTLMTGIEEVKKGGRAVTRRVGEGYVSHWTVLKDEDGRGRWVVLTIAPK